MVRGLKKTRSWCIEFLEYSELSDAFCYVYVDRLARVILDYLVSDFGSTRNALYIYPHSKKERKGEEKIPNHKNYTQVL